MNICENYVTLPPTDVYRYSKIILKIRILFWVNTATASSRHTSRRLSAIFDFDCPLGRHGRRPVTSQWRRGRPRRDWLSVISPSVVVRTPSRAYVLSGRDRQTPCDRSKDRAQNPFVRNQPVLYVSSRIIYCCVI